MLFTDRRVRLLFLVNFLLYLAIFGFSGPTPTRSTWSTSLPRRIGRVGVRRLLGPDRHREPRPLPLAVHQGEAADADCGQRRGRGRGHDRHPPARNAGIDVNHPRPGRLCAAICLPSAAAMISLALPGAEQGRILGVNQSLQVGAEALANIGGGLLAAILIPAPPVAFGVAARSGQACSSAPCAGTVPARRFSRPTDASCRRRPAPIHGAYESATQYPHARSGKPFLGPS